VVVGLESLVLLGLGVAELASLNSSRLAMGASTALFFVAAGVGLAACAWGLWRSRRFGRGPVLMAQLVALGLAWNMRVGETRIFAVALVVAAAVVIVGMLTPASMSALEEDGEPGAE
jgi:hypothetical protein